MKVVESERTLRVETEYFIAEAVWRKIYGVWSCFQASKVIRWMVGQREQEAKVALLKMGAKWEWRKP
jgi:hypothetical protein